MGTQSYGIGGSSKVPMVCRVPRPVKLVKFASGIVKKRGTNRLESCGAKSEPFHAMTCPTAGGIESL